MIHRSFTNSKKKIYIARKLSLMLETFQLFRGQRSSSLHFPSGSGASAKGAVYAGPLHGTAAGNLSTSPTSRTVVALLLFGLPDTSSLEAHKSGGPNAFQPSITGVSKRNSTSPRGFSPSLLLFLSCPLPRGWVVFVSCPHLVFLLLLASYQLDSSSHPPNHGGNGSAPSQPRGAHGQAAPPLHVAAAAAPAPARLPRLLLPVSPAAAAARGVGRARDEGGGGQDGRGDHREVRARVRPLESVQLQGGGRGGRRGEEVADGPGQGAPGQVRRRVPGHLHLPLHRLLHPLLPPHQRRRRRAGPACQGRDRDRGDRREGRDLRAGLRRAQGRVADQVPADGGADAGGGQLDWQDQEGRRLMRRHSSILSH